ncbi:PilN domain-containing protein [Pseudoxanthomonas beigongshangi]|jgi:type IV pilus assembly protein PilN
MARINLLPWRAERRAQRQRDFYAMLGLAALAGVLLSFLLWFHYDRQISGQMVRNDFLKGEIQKVEGQIQEIETLDKQKDRLLARKKVIEQLQANRSQMVHLFDSLVRTIPDGVALSNIKQEGEVLTLEGRAQSNARVSEYMRKLEGSGWMTKPDLAIIEAKAEDAKALSGGVSSSLPYVFNLQVRLANPNASEGKDGEAPDGTAVPVADATATAAPAAAAPVTPVVPADGKAPAAAPAPASQPATPATTPAAPANPAPTPANSPGNAS